MKDLVKELGTIHISNMNNKNLKASFTFAQASRANQKHLERNEDYLLVDRRYGLAVVCDGVGTVIGAEQGARIAATTIKTRWQQLIDQSMALPTQVEAEREAFDLEQALCDMLEEANKAVIAHGKMLMENKAQSDDKNKTSGYANTTVVLAALISQDDNYTMVYAHVGDSRIYLLRPHETLRRLTVDDGYFQLQQSKDVLDEQTSLRIEQASLAHELSEQERDHFERRNGITQSLGDEHPKYHLGQIELCPGDRVLLCTDGIHDNLTDAEIAEILRTGARTTVAKKLLQQALTYSQRDTAVHIRARNDDMSAIVITYHPSDHLPL